MLDGGLATAMSLRDWLAGMALQGLIAGLAHTEVWAELSEQQLAYDAYLQADAMLTAREGRDA